MIKNIIISFISAGLTISTSQASENDVIDLGSLEVKGEVRQPPIRFYQPNNIPVTVLRNVSELNFESFEKELLRPANVEQILKEDTK